MPDDALADVASHLQCFYEYVDAGNKLTGSYEVLSGGLLDIDATVRTHAYEPVPFRPAQASVSSPSLVALGSSSGCVS